MIQKYYNVARLHYVHVLFKLRHSFSFLHFTSFLNIIIIYLNPSPACSDHFYLPILIQVFLGGFLREFSQEVKDWARQIEYAAVGIYNRLSVDLLPTPAKFHYVFNLWDFFRCVQGET